MTSDDTPTVSGNGERTVVHATALTGQRSHPVLSVVLLLVLGPVIGLVLVVGAQLVPDDTIIDRLLDGQATGQLSSVDYPVSSYGNQIDKFSECATLTVGLDENADTNALTSAVRSYIPSLSCTTMSDSLTAVQQEIAPENAVGYYRYWHGYSVVTRPVLLVTQVSVLRAIVLGLILTPLVLLSIRVVRLFGQLALLSLLVPYVVVTDFVDLADSIPHGLATAAALWCCLLAVRQVSRGPVISEAVIVAVAGGMIVAFFDILLVAPTTFCLTAALVSAIIYSHSRSRRASLLAGLVVSVTWVLSYCWMWSTKWIVTMPMEGVRAVLDHIRGAAAYRLDGARADVDPAFGASFVKNLRFWVDRPLGATTLIFAAGLLVYVVGRHARPREVLAQTVSIAAIPIVSVIGWYVAFSNHTQTHPGWTYRSIGVAIGVIMFAATMQPTAVARPNVAVAPRWAANRRVADEGLVDSPASSR